MDHKDLEFEMHSVIGSLFFKFYFWVKYTSGQLMPTKMSSEKLESIQMWGCSHQTLMKRQWSPHQFLTNLSYHSIIFVPGNFLTPLRPIFWEGLVFLLIAVSWHFFHKQACSGLQRLQQTRKPLYLCLHLLLSHFGADKTFITCWSGSRGQVWVQVKVPAITPENCSRRRE